MAPVSFFDKPGQYMSWAVRAKPAIFWSLVIGGLGPVFAVGRKTIHYTYEGRGHRLMGTLV
jgi:hypothetical protein